ncbi:hypothetical protein D3C72_1858300 [compost metagenome]
MDLEKCRIAFGLGDKGTHTLQTHQHAFDGQFAQGAVDGHPAHAKLVEEFALGRQLAVGAPDAGTDLLQDDVLDPCIQRGGAFKGKGGQGRVVVGRLGHRDS